MAAWLSSTGISHHNLFPHLPSIRLSESTAVLALGLLYTPQIPTPSCCSFQGTLIPVWGTYGYSKDCLILIPFRMPKISYFTLSLKMFLL